MEIYNPDGSQVEMCGNALRAVALYIRQRKKDLSESLSIETAGGITQAIINDDQVTVNMGVPSFTAESIGLSEGSDFIGTEFQFTESIVRNISCVSMGNPHCVQFVDSTKNCHLETEALLLKIMAYLRIEQMLNLFRFFHEMKLICESGNVVLAKR